MHAVAARPKSAGPMRVDDRSAEATLLKPLEQLTLSDVATLSGHSPRLLDFQTLDFDVDDDVPTHTTTLFPEHFPPVCCFDCCPGCPSTPPPPLSASVSACLYLSLCVLRCAAPHHAYTRARVLACFCACLRVPVHVSTRVRAHARTRTHTCLRTCTNLCFGGGRDGVLFLRIRMCSCCEIAFCLCALYCGWPWPRPGLPHATPPTPATLNSNGHKYVCTRTGRCTAVRVC